MRTINQKGFSLLELVIIISIIMIMAALALPQLNSYAVNRSIKAAARAIESDIFELKERAIAENVQYAIGFNVGATTYTIQRPPGVTIQTKDLTAIGNGITITAAGFGGAPTVTFQPRGTVNNTGSVTVTNTRGSTGTVAANISGRTSVQFNLQ